MKKIETKYYVGIDEVGRGPLAGPVTVGVFSVSEKIFSSLKKEFKKKKIKDSKKLKGLEREECFKYFKKIKSENQKDIFFTTFSFDAKKIDKFGISFCIKKAIKKSLEKLKLNPKESKIYLDGSLYAPEEFKNQETIIKGDEKNSLISSASIIAKVTRDRFMNKISKKFPEYGFDKNKGYGTKEHIKAIKKHGKCEIHRKSFCQNILQ